MFRNKLDFLSTASTLSAVSEVPRRIDVNGDNNSLYAAQAYYISYVIIHVSMKQKQN